MHSKCSPAFSRVNCVSSSVKKKTAGKQQHKGGGSCLASNKFVCFGAHYSFFCKHGSHAFATFSILSRKKNHSFIVEKSGLLYLPFFWKKLTRLGMGGGGEVKSHLQQIYVSCARKKKFVASPFAAPRPQKMDCPFLQQSNCFLKKKKQEQTLFRDLRH